MLKNLENNGTGEIGLVTPAPELCELIWFIVRIDDLARGKAMPLK